MDLCGLTTGCLAKMLREIAVYKPIVQVLGIKCIAVADGTSRYRLLLSDGKNTISTAMLGRQINSYADENKLIDNTIIRVEKYIVVSQDKKVIVILDLTILHTGDEVETIIGSPQPLTNIILQTQNVDAAAASLVSTVSTSTVTACGSSFRSTSLTNEMMQGSKRDPVISPISNLKPYKGEWTIKARVTSKSAVRIWSNKKGQGNFFNMDLKDESGEIRASAFNEVCDKFFHMIQIDKVYSISKCALKDANKQFTGITHDYEVVFTNGTIIAESIDTDVVNTNRSLIDSLDPKIFTNNGPHPKEIVEISGGMNVGKSTRLMHIMARVILPIAYGGKNAKVLFMVTAHKFDLSQFMNILEKFIREADTTMTDLTRISKIVKNSLGNITFKCCFNFLQFEIGILQLDGLFANDNGYCMLTVDSICAFYWSEVSDTNKITMATYTKRMVKKLIKIIDDHQLVLVYIKPAWYLPNEEEDPEPIKVHYWMELAPVSEEKLDVQS